MNSTRILFWNCQGVSRRRLELLQLAQDQKIDVILLNETHLPTHRQFKLPNYFSYYTNKTQTGNQPPAGGTAILVNRNLIHHSTSVSTSSITNTIAHIHIGNSDLSLISVYKSPGTALDTSDLDALLGISENVIIAGDLNAKHQSWHSRVNNNAGRILSQYINSRYDITIAAPTSPTHYPDNPSHAPDVLDVAIMKTGRLAYQLDNLTTELSSDHSPIIIDLFHNATQISPPKPSHSINWINFEENLKSISLTPPNISSPTGIDTAIDTITNLLSDTIANNTTSYTPIDYKNDLPRHIKSAITLKRRLRSQWQRHRDPAIKTEYNRQSELVRDLLHARREEEWHNFLGSIDSQSFGWSKLYKLNRRLLRKTPAEQPLRNRDGTLIYEHETKAELFADSMENQFQTPDFSHPNDDFIYNTILNHNNSSAHRKQIFFSPGEVRNVIRRLPNRKAPGPDKISNCALKHISNRVIIYICKIFNGCARQEYFPKSWKLAEVIMLPKPGKDPKIPTNHRPISLLNSLSKVLERLLLNRLSIYIHPKLSPDQYGFRPHHSTTLQLINVIDDIIIRKNKRLKTVAALLDVEKAFDKVWHAGLIFKLITSEVPTQLTNIIKSFLLNRQFYVKTGHSTSTHRPIHAGVPQGSCLSPQLFALYINDMPQIPSAKKALFADDTLLYASGATNISAVRNLQLQLDRVQPWFDQWRITINASKTETIFFTHKSIQTTPKIRIKDTTLDWSKQIKYLGIHIDAKLNFNKQVQTAIRKAKGVRHHLFPLINQKSPLRTRVKINIYKTYILPILIYAGPAWFSNISKSNMEKMEAVQSTTLRTIFDPPWFVNNIAIRNSAKIKSISNIISDNSEKLKQSIVTSHFPHINHISKRTNSTYPPKNKRPINF